MRAFCVFLTSQLFLLNGTAYAADTMQIAQHINRGNAFVQTHKFGAAIQEYTEALKLDPENRIAKGNIEKAHNNWGSYYFRQKKFADAQREWETALQMNPQDKDTLHNIAILQRVLDQQNAQADQEAPPRLDEEFVGGNTPAAAPAKDGVSAYPSGALSVPPDDSLPGATSAAVKSGGNNPAKPPTANAAKTAVPAAPGNAAVSPAPKAAIKLQMGVDEFSTEGPSASQVPASQPARGQAEIPQESPSSDTGILGAVKLIKPESKLPVPPTPAAQPEVEALPPWMVAPAYPQPSQTPATIIQGMPAVTSEPVATPAPAITAPPVTPAAAPAATAGSGSLQDALSSLEIKIYGSPQAGLTVLQRLERLEIQTSGHTASGTMINRLNALKRDFGI